MIGQREATGRGEQHAFRDVNTRSIILYSTANWRRKYAFRNRMGISEGVS